MTFLNKPPLGAQLDFAHPLNKGLVGFWLLNEGHGDKVYDLSMNGNTGTLTNMAFPSTPSSGWNPGRNGVGLQFDGSNDYVEVPDSATLDISSSITILTWVWIPSQADIPHYGFITKSDEGGGSGEAYRLTYNTNPNQLQFIIGIGASTFTAASSGLVSGWHQIGGLYNGSTVRVILDGVFDGPPTAATGSINNITAALEIGRAAGGKYFDGTLDEVRIYNRALSAQEIMELYTNPYGMFLPGIMADIRSNPAGASVTV